MNRGDLYSDEDDGRSLSLYNYSFAYTPFSFANVARMASAGSGAWMAAPFQIRVYSSAEHVLAGRTKLWRERAHPALSSGRPSSR